MHRASNIRDHFDVMPLCPPRDFNTSDLGPAQLIPPLDPVAKSTSSDSGNFNFSAAPEVAPATMLLPQPAPQQQEDIVMLDIDWEEWNKLFPAELGNDFLTTLKTNNEAS